MSIELSRDLVQIQERIEQGWQLRVKYRPEFWPNPFHATLERNNGRYNTIGESQRDALSQMELWLFDLALGRKGSAA